MDYWSEGEGSLSFCACVVYERVKDRNARRSNARCVRPIETAHTPNFNWGGDLSEELNPAQFYSGRSSSFDKYAPFSIESKT